MSDHEQEHADQATAPPTEAEAGDLAYVASGQETKWPKVIGGLSLVYALLGMLCAFGMVGSPWLTEWATRLGGLTLEFPVWLKITAVVSGVLMFSLGLVMFFGSINVLRRRRSGVKMLKFWAVGRLVLIILGFALNVVMAPQNIEFQRQAVEIQNKRVRDAGREDLVQEFSDDELWWKGIRNSAIASAVFSIYPVFIGFFLSRRKIDAEIVEWDSMHEV